MSRAAKIIGTFVILICVLSACSMGGSPPAAAGVVVNDSEQNTTGQMRTGSEPALPLNGNGEQIVATVNNEEITLAEFERAFARKQQQSSASYDALATSVLNILIEQDLINQAAERMQIVITDEEIEAQFQDHRNVLPNEAAWQAWLDENMFTEDELRQSLKDAILTERLITAIIQPEDSQVEQIRARHILVTTEQQADEVMSRLGNGEDFATLAAALSNDVTTREHGGDLGWFTRDGLLTPELADVAFELQPNEITGPVATMLGYHIIQTLETGQRQAMPEEQSELAAAQFTQWLQSLLDDAVIERYIDF